MCRSPRSTRAFAHVSTASIDTSLKSSRAFCCCYSTWISRRTRHVGLIEFSAERGISTTAHVAAPPHQEPPRERSPRRSPHGATTRVLDGRLTSPTSPRREHRSECSRGPPPERTSPREPAPLRSPRASRPFGDAPRCSREPCRRLGAGCSRGARHPKNSCHGAAHVAHVAEFKTAVSGLRRRCADACTDEPC